MQAFPLQHKKMQRLTLPYLCVGTCEVMNVSPYCMMDSFHVVNAKNKSVYQAFAKASGTSPSSADGSHGTTPASVPFLGELVGGGLVDSYTGGVVTRFISAYLSRALMLHTIVPTEIRKLRKEFPEEPLIDLMGAATQRHRAIHQPHRSHGAVASSAGSSLRSVVTDTDMQQYAVSADAAFFKACSVLLQARDGANDRRRKDTLRTSPYEHYLAEVLTNAIETSAPLVPMAPADPFSSEALNAVRDSGCRAAWFSATVTPSALELQRRLTMLQEQKWDQEHSRGSGGAPPPRKTLADHDSGMEREIAHLKDVAREHPFCLEVSVSNLGDSRAFGIAFNPFTEGNKSLLDPTRERVVPLSVDHRPFRQEEFRRITQAGGKVESAAGEVIDGNPFYNVSRSFGHWAMKSDPRRSPVQQKLSALPHSSTWHMLPGDVLLLANHAVFATRNEEDSSVDEIAKVAGREIRRGASPEQVAAAVCDFAVRFGAPHSLQVMVAQAKDGQPAHAGDVEVQQDTDGALCTSYEFEEWVEPGPLYVEACRNLPPFRDAFVRDCARCDVTPAEMVAKRWERVRERLPLRHALSLMPYYGRECGILQQIMDEEATFFDQDALRVAEQPSRGSSLTECVVTSEMRESFQSLARSLLGAKR